MKSAAASSLLVGCIACGKLLGFGDDDDSAPRPSPVSVDDPAPDASGSANGSADGGRGAAADAAADVAPDSETGACGLYDQACGADPETCCIESGLVCHPLRLRCCIGPGKPAANAEACCSGLLDPGLCDGKKCCISGSP